MATSLEVTRLITYQFDRGRVGVASGLPFDELEQFP